MVAEPNFERVSVAWSAFTANDINNDGELDVREIQKLIWLVTDKKPSKAIMDREMNIMDDDRSGTISRVEWVSYLSAPVIHENHIGNNEYYDFELRDLFEQIDADNDGSIDFEELCQYIKSDLGAIYQLLDSEFRAQAENQILSLATECMKSLKLLAKEITSPFLPPNNDQTSVTWVEFQKYNQVCKN